MAILNEGIRSKSVQLISSSGENKGVIETVIALSMAREEGKDLVLMSETGAMGVPIVKILDHKKKLYEEKKNIAKSRKNQHDVQTKELRLSPKIADHDLFSTKGRQAVQFLLDGHRVKFVILFRGRERALKDTLGVGVFARLFSFFNENQLLSGKELVIEEGEQTSSSLVKLVYLKKIQTNKQK